MNGSLSHELESLIELARCYWYGLLDTFRSMPGSTCLLNVTIPQDLSLEL
jgi:hypothetical protein